MILILLPSKFLWKISQTINSIIKHKYFITKTRQRNFANMICSNLCNLLWFIFILCLILVLQNKTSTYSLCLLFSRTFLLTGFTFLISPPSKTIDRTRLESRNFYIFCKYIYIYTETTIQKKWNIFDFNPGKSLIMLHLTSSFIIAITFLLTRPKNFESFG